MFFTVTFVATLVPISGFSPIPKHLSPPLLYPFRGIKGRVLSPSMTTALHSTSYFAIKNAPSKVTYESMSQYFQRSKFLSALSANLLIKNKQLFSDLIVFMLCELFSHKLSTFFYYFDEMVFKKIIGQPSFVNKYAASFWYFVEERGHAVGRLFMWNFFAKIACLVLSKLGFRIKPDFPAFISKVFFILFCFNSIDKIKRKFLSISFPQNTENRRQMYVFNKFSTFLINTIGILIACESTASYLKVPLSSLLAFGGVGGLTLGLSVKGIVGNFLGGLLLLVNEPFTPGDMVMFRSGLSSRDKDLVGRVESVGWGQTQIRLSTVCLSTNLCILSLIMHLHFVALYIGLLQLSMVISASFYLVSMCCRGNDTRPTYVPNSHFVSIPVTNIERITHRKYETKVSLCYEDFSSMGGVISSIKSRLKKIPKIDILSQPFRVSFTEITPTGLDIEVLCYFATKSVDEFLRLQEVRHNQ